MAKQTRNTKSGEKTSRKKGKKKGLTTEELRRKHMSDPNHSITEEELKNVEIDMHVATEGPLDITSEDERPHDVDKDHRIKTPWDVLDKP